MRRGPSRVHSRSGQPPARGNSERACRRRDSRGAQTGGGLQVQVHGCGRCLHGPVCGGVGVEGDGKRRLARALSVPRHACFLGMREGPWLGRREARARGLCGTAGLAKRRRPHAHQAAPRVPRPKRCANAPSEGVQRSGPLSWPFLITSAAAPMQRFLSSQLLCCSSGYCCPFWCRADADMMLIRMTSLQLLRRLQNRISWGC
jgi:hypothetical protein